MEKILIIRIKRRSLRGGQRGTRYEQKKAKNDDNEIITRIFIGNEIAIRRMQ